MSYREVSEIRDGMRIDWDMPIKMDDGLVLRCDIYRPVKAGKYPVILTYGPYAKWLHFDDLYHEQWQRMCEIHPDVPTGSTNKYQCWEVVDPEKWVPDGYAVVRVDSRGAGRSPGYLAHNNKRENDDFHQCIEWAAAQPWCSGKVGMNGISYYASNQWRAAAAKPPHLAAICVWEGWSDNYRDGNRHGGILCTFRKNWQDMQVKTVQHGVGERGRKHPVTGGWACGPETLTPEELIANREDMAHQLLTRHGIVTRDAATIEHLPGGFSAIYPVLRRLEETGRIRRGYFVAGLGAAQFAQPGAVDLLRDARDERRRAQGPRRHQRERPEHRQTVTAGTRSLARLVWRRP